MGDVMLSHGRHGCEMDCWDNVLDQLSVLQDSSRCHSSSEDASYQTQHLCEDIHPPAQGTQLEQQGQEPSNSLLQSLEEYLASSTASEHPDAPPLYGRYDGLAMDGSCASSQSDDSFLALMLGPFSSQQSASGSLTAGAALPDAPVCPSLSEAGQAACAEQPPRGSGSPCLEASPELSDHPMLDDLYLQADSSDGSADWFSAAPAQAPSFGTDPSTLQQAAQPLPAPGKRRGRPRRYDTTLPLGTMDAHMAASVATVNGMQPGVRKRGAKPKYKFMTAEEAVAHRRERNRSTAIATHEKKKAREAALKAELSMRQGEHDALQRLLDYVQKPKADKEMVRKLLLGEEGAEGSICDAMEFLLTAED